MHGHFYQGRKQFLAGTAQKQVSFNAIIHYAYKMKGHNYVNEIKYRISKVELMLLILLVLSHEADPNWISILHLEVD